MTPAARADAHIHCFAGGYRPGFAGLAGVELNEAACYRALAGEHRIGTALLIGYAGESWCRGNNAHIAAIARTEGAVDTEDLHFAPLAYCDARLGLTVVQLSAYAADGFIGVSLYTFDAATATALTAIDDAVWRWLSERCWLVSVNARGEFWEPWQRIVSRHPALRVLIAHLGLPPAVAVAPSPDAARRALAGPLALAAFPEVRVKLSGFYALSDPGYDYPHAAVWPYVEALIEGFGIGRLLWGSDFSPCLSQLSFPQTLTVFEHLSFLDADGRRRIEGDNLLTLLAEIIKTETM